MHEKEEKTGGLELVSLNGVGSVGGLGCCGVDNDGAQTRLATGYEKKKQMSLLLRRGSSVEDEK